MNKENMKKIVAIVDRADKLGIINSSKFTLLMDLKCAHKEFNLRLDDFINADDFNFVHDVAGIQKHINRDTKKMDDMFVPRFASY